MDQTPQISLQAESIQALKYFSRSSRDPDEDSRPSSKALEFKSKSKSNPSSSRSSSKALEFIVEKTNQRNHRDCNTHILKSNTTIVAIFSCLDYYFLDANFIVYKFWHAQWDNLYLSSQLFNHQSLTTSR